MFIITKKWKVGLISKITRIVCVIFFNYICEINRYKEVLGVFFNICFKNIDK